MMAKLESGQQYMSEKNLPKQQRLPPFFVGFLNVYLTRRV
jgi:hypothetical protein